MRERLKDKRMKKEKELRGSRDLFNDLIALPVIAGLRHAPVYQISKTLLYSCVLEVVVNAVKLSSGIKGPVCKI